MSELVHDGNLLIYKGQTSSWAMLPGEEMEFWTRFSPGADPKGIDFMPQLPDQGRRLKGAPYPN